jgi:hypothetical protein
MRFSGNALHLVAHNVPWPADNGGLMDVFYKVRALAEIGVRVHLHAFVYDRPPSEELLRYCASVNWYPRRHNPLLLLKPEPFIVASRRHTALRKALRQKTLPILFDTLHTTAFLGHPALRDQPQFVRTHNIEHHYYRGLSAAAQELLRKSYYKLEACKLQTYEKNLRKAAGLFAISAADAEHFAQYAPTETILPFHPYHFQVPEETEAFALYHGNLSVEENQKAAEWLLTEVWHRPEVQGIPLIIAGNGAPESLKRRVYANPNVQLRDNISLADILKLVEKARLHVLPTFQATGVKLKLIAALAKGLQVLCNTWMVKGTGLEDCVTIADNAEDFAQSAWKLFHQAQLPASQLQARRHVFETQLDNRKNAEKIAFRLGLL